MPNKLSFNEKQGALRQALRDKLGLTPESTILPWLRDVWDDELIYELSGQLYRATYSFDKDGKPILGAPEKVKVEISYVTMESLQAKYADLIQEVGKRKLDAALPQLKVLETCKNLLASSGADNARIAEAVKECEACLSWVKQQPDPSNPVEQFREIARTQPQKAAAYLSPGGFAGKKLNIPTEALPALRLAVREGYQKLNLPDMPKWVKEPVEIRDYIHESTAVAVSEATKETLAKGIVPIRIIQPGFNTSKTRHYTESAVKDAVKLFEGAKMYADHATKTEEKEKPERSIRDWVATVRNARVAGNGNAVAEAHIHAGWLKDMVSNLSEIGNLDKLGVSINAIGKGSKQKVNGTETFVVESLVDYPFKSVDFVTEAGAGGQVGVKESAIAEVVDAYLIDLAKLREVRPDLIREIESEIDSKNKAEVKKLMETEQEIQTLKESVEALTKENTGLKADIAKGKEQEAKMKAQATIKEAVEKSTLPQPSKERILNQFKEAITADGIDAAIKAESDYLAKITEAGKVKSLGNSNPDPRQAREKLVESFMASGMTRRQAEIAADGR